MFFCKMSSVTRVGTLLTKSQNKGSNKAYKVFLTIINSHYFGCKMHNKTCLNAVIKFVKKGETAPILFE